jgi:hypothetical protein
MMTHTSKSRFNINWKFMENLNISKDYLIKAIKHILVIIKDCSYKEECF